MCVVSNIGGGYAKTVPERWPWVGGTPAPAIIPEAVSRGEFDALKRTVERMERELRAARAQDIAEGNPDCQHGDKVALVKKLAEAFGLDLEDVFG